MQVGFGFYLLCHGTCIFEVSQMQMEIAKHNVLTAKLIKIQGVKIFKVPQVCWGSKTGTSLLFLNTMRFVFPIIILPKHLTYRLLLVPRIG